MAERVWVGVDLGTQSVRAVAVAEDGTVPVAAARPLQSTRWTADDGSARHEQDPQAWCHAVDEVLAEVVAELGRRGVPASAVSGLAVDGTSGTVVPVDRAGTPSGPGVMYDDARGRDRAEKARAAGAALWEKLGYRVGDAWALPTLLAMEQAPGYRHQTDVVTAHLVGGQTATDSSTALKTGYDPIEKRWPTEVFAELGLDVDRLPEVVSPGTVLGGVGARTAEATGLVVGTPVVAGMTDGCAAQIGAGAVAPGMWNTVLGTTLVLKGVTETLLHDPSGTVYCHRGPQGGWWWPGGASSTGSAVLNDVVGKDRFAAVTEALEADPGIVPPVVYPLGGHGERFPFDAPDAEGFVLRPDGGSDPLSALGALSAEVAFAGIAEGVAFVERFAYERVAALGADVSGARTISGGATANPWWNQRRADVLGVPLRRPVAAEPAVGMALLARAGQGGGEPDLVAVAEAVQGGEVYEPREVAGLSDRYAAFREALVARGWIER